MVLSRREPLVVRTLQQGLHRQAKRLDMGMTLHGQTPACGAPSGWAPAGRGYLALAGPEASRSRCHDGVSLMILYVLLRDLVLLHCLAACGLLR
jgi:hypothetical protein